MNSFCVRQLSLGYISLTSCCVSGDIRRANFIFSLGIYDPPYIDIVGAAASGGVCAAS